MTKVRNLKVLIAILALGARAQGIYRHRKGDCNTGRVGYAANWQPGGPAG